MILRTRLLVLAMALGLMGVASPDAQARPRPRASKFSSNKTFGLGLMVGAPTGLSGKYYLSADTGIDFGLGVIGGYGNRDGVHLHADFLWHPAVLASVDPFVLPIYVGIGGRLWDYDDRRDNIDDDDLALGARVPLGIMMDFNNVPIDIFFEMVFVLDFFVDQGAIDLELNGALGIRYYFM